MKEKEQDAEADKENQAVVDLGAEERFMAGPQEDDDVQICTDPLDVTPKVSLSNVIEKINEGLMVDFDFQE